MGYVHRFRTAALVVDEETPNLAVRANAESAAYLREVCELLWPPPAEITLNGMPGWPHHPGPVRPDVGGAPGSPCREFMLIPFGHRPALVVPAERRLAAAAVRHLNAQKTWQARLARKALSAGLASGLGKPLVRGRMRVTEPARGETIESYLRTALSCELRVSMYLGPARANRKPILQLLSPTGDPIGFAKVGVNPLTRELVRAERAALTRLAGVGLTQSRVPRVMHHAEWHGLEILVLTALPVWLRRSATSSDRLAAAMTEVSRIDGLTSRPLAASSYLRRLTTRLAEADGSPNQVDLLRTLEALVARSGGTELTYGSWHGDWSPWNMANTGDGLLLWDWERFTCDVPLGFDALHHWLQTAIGPRGRESGAAAAECIDRAAELIAPFGIDASQARLTAALYMADLATRYLVDQQAKAGGRLGDPGTWLIPAIAREVTRLPLKAAR